ncbi:MAG: DnaJ domain-containing protein [Bdellovibrionales bacterium]|nr:DnaJ domain-containing protein [Bdellovibrionales bacterium]
MKAASNGQSHETQSAQGFEQPPHSAPHSQDPAHLAYLMGTLGPAYFRPQTSRAYPSRPKPPPPPHALSEAQRAAYDFFALHGNTLSPAFSQKELKKAFRVLALKLHPDTNKGAVASAFIELKKNYETLMDLF